MNAGPAGSIAEIARDTYRISIAMPEALIAIPGGFSFNQYLILDEQPLLFHTGPRKLFRLVCEQIEKVAPASELRHIAFSHFEADECGSLADFLTAAPGAQPVCSEIGAMVSVSDIVDVPPLGMADGQALDIGRHRLRWMAAPHVPHGWDCGYLFDETTKTLLCGDLFTQPGSAEHALVSDDILGASEAMRARGDYYAHAPNTSALLDKLARLRPDVLACMHGSAWQGDGAGLLRELDRALTTSPT